MPKKNLFVGREDELDILKTLYGRVRPSLVVIKGRRRIGKSRLIAEFVARYGKGTFWSFAGIAPIEGMTAQDQRDHFARQLASYVGSEPLVFRDWSDAFDRLSLHLKEGDILLFDEISWMGSYDVTFVSKLKAWWDKQENSFLFVLCGSVSTWIEENILKSTAFFGRINRQMTIEPLSIPESAELLRRVGFKGSTYDTYMLLAVMGGVPWYLEQASVGHTAEAIIRQLCFTKDGSLVLEFDRIFHDLFNGTGTTYKKILDVLKDGMKTLPEIRRELDVGGSGTLGTLLEHLTIAGFVDKQPLWSFKTKKRLQQSLYRICDPYTRFYLKVMEPDIAQIKRDGLKDVSFLTTAGFETHMGLQIEYLLLQNHALLLKRIGVNRSDVVDDGPYRQMKTTAQQGCQIDYLVQTVTNNLFVCEFKFKREELGQSIIKEMRQKINALNVPRGFAPVPVLFELGGVSDSVATGGYFYRIIDIGSFLQ